MKKLKENISRLKEIYESYPHSFVFDSIIEGNTPAKIFVDDTENISIFLICESHCIYFGGESTDRSKYKEAINFFKNELLSDNMKKELRIVKVNYYSKIWEEELMEGLKEFDYKIFDRSLFKQDLKNIPMINSSNNVIIKNIDGQLLNNTQLGNLQCVIDEVTGMWGSVDNFVNNGFGCCAVIDENIISWCTAEYISKNCCGIGIETIEEQERNGIATVISNEFLRICLELKITPYWDSWTRNIPSVRVAEKNGFEKVCDYKILFIEFD